MQMSKMWMAGCLAAFLATDYEGGRHDRRVAKLSPNHSAQDLPQEGVIQRVDD